MSKRRKGKAKGRKRVRRTSPLTSHTRREKKLVPPLMNMPVPISFTNWLTDVFPDMLWLSCLISEDVDDGMRAATAALNLVDEVLSEASTEGAVVMDGRLSSWERVPATARAEVIERLENAGGYTVAVPEDFAHALGIYPEAPGSWLIERWRERGLTVDWEIAQRYLSGVIKDAHHGQSDVATRAKFIVVARWAKGGKLHVARGSGADDTYRLYPKYPDGLTDDERALVEASVRATFGVLVNAIADEQGNVAAEWGKEFWRSKWSKFACALPDVDSPETSDPDRLEQLHDSLRGEAEAIYAQFLNAYRSASLLGNRSRDGFRS